MAGSVGQPTQGWFPWQAIKSSTGTWNRTNDTVQLGMGYWYLAPASINDQFGVDLYMDSVTWKCAITQYRDTNQGIATVSLDGSSIGTFDLYGSSTANIYMEITGISVSTAGLKAVLFKMASKNASSLGYSATLSSIAFIATSGTYSTPGGSDTPGYTWQYFPWMGTKSNTQFNTPTQSSARLGGGYLNSNGNQNNEWQADVWLDSGTYKYCQVQQTNASQGIFTIKLDGSSVGTLDAYSVGDTNNVYVEITGITVAAPTAPRTLQTIMATKNGSSAAYYGCQYSVSWIRTGA